MLEEDEWRIVEDQLIGARAETRGGSDALIQAALATYERVTGFPASNVNALYHHRVALYGPPCRNCGRPLRTPEARLCGSCMAPREGP